MPTTLFSVEVFTERRILIGNHFQYQMFKNSEETVKKKLEKNPAFL